MTVHSFQVLAESSQFVLGHSYETVVVVRKSDGVELVAGDHYGDPKIGLISNDQLWFVTVGEGLQCYSLLSGLHTFFRRGAAPLGPDSPESCLLVHRARLESSYIVRILIDPWSDFASVWHLDLRGLSLLKLSDGPFLSGSPFYEHIEF